MTRILKTRIDRIRQHYWIVANKVKSAISPFSSKVEVAGSLRRKASPSDVDIVAIPKDYDGLKKALSKHGKITAAGSQRLSADVDGVSVDVFLSKKEEYPSQLLRRTGPAGANIKNSEIARSKGLLLNEHGLFHRKSGKRVVVNSEEDIYKKLGKSFRKPEDRGKLR